jgi:hypothetical protein
LESEKGFFGFRGREIKGETGPIIPKTVNIKNFITRLLAIFIATLPYFVKKNIFVIYDLLREAQIY